MSDEILKSPLNKSALERLEGALLELPPMEIKYVHTFAPGVYVREAHIKAGMVGIGHEHRQETVNVLLKGKIRLANSDGSVLELTAPMIFTSAAGVRKTAHFIEDTVFLNVLPNPTNETNVQKLEDLFVIKSEIFLQHEAEQAKLAERQAIEEGKL